jgi:retron-type reverse transcriptase
MYYMPHNSATTGRNILEAAAAIREIIAAGNNRRGGICLITLDFKSAFDNISHKYLYGLLREYRYGAGITRAIVSLYEHATSHVAINGHTSDFQLKRSIRLGCPLSSILYALAVNPFILLLNKHLQGLQIDQQHTTACVAYADDSTVVINNKRDLQILHRLISIYEKATGARINWEKTKGLPIGNWDRQRQLLGIQYTSVATILVITFGADIPTSVEHTWTRKIHQTHGSVKDHHS